MLYLFLLIALGFAGPETDGIPPAGLVEEVSDAGVRVSVERATPGDSSELVVRYEGKLERHGSLNAYGLVIRPSGSHVAFVSGRSGLASVWVLEVSTGVLRQVSNVGLERAKHASGKPPAGYQELPKPGTLRFEAEQLVWEGADSGTEEAAAWR